MSKTVNDIGAKNLREAAKHAGAKAVYFFNGVCGMRLLARSTGVTYIGTDGAEHMPPTDMRPPSDRLGRLLAQGRMQSWGTGYAACNLSIL